VTTATKSTELVYTRTFDASRKDVWAVFTEVEHLKHWWGIPGAPCTIAKLELKPGGEFLYANKLPDGRTMGGRSTFREIAPPEKLVWLNGSADEKGKLIPNPWIPTLPAETLNTVTFEEQDGKTVMTMTIAPYNASEDEAAAFLHVQGGMRMGINGLYEGLAAYLAKRA
jgi:uncharacterized protein YndB with AHSA1/START domain